MTIFNIYLIDRGTPIQVSVGDKDAEDFHKFIEERNVEIEFLRAKLVETEKYRRDAELYRELRSKYWSEGKEILCVIRSRDLRVGIQTYTGALLDAAIASQQSEGAE